MIGQMVSHYKVLEKLGEGGMGVVYKAQDTKLDRTVALKFLPEQVSAGPKDLERFVQEAKAAAGLSHPNICTIYGIEESEGKHFIVMEYVDGQTLQEKKSTLSMKQALDFGIQIAEGLAAAHEKGIVHRDIKPENIMIRKDGRVQIMDFGLAKLRGASRLTKEGSTVGTAGYMSPEQIQGQETDHRSDIFSLGVLLYEMFSGQPPFKGLHETAIAYEVVNVDSPPLSSIKPDIPPELDAIVLECLEKDPNERAQSAKQIAIDLNRFKRTSSRARLSRTMPAQVIPKTAPATASPATSWRIVIAISIVTALIGIAIGWVLFRTPAPPSQPVVRFTIPFQGEDSVGEDGYRFFAIAPDGSQLAYTSMRSSKLYVRRMDQNKGEALPGIDIVGSSTDNISYAPDSRWLAFVSVGKLFKQSLSGGTPVAICDVVGEWYGDWGPNGDVIFTKDWGSNLMTVASAAGSTPRQLTTLKTAEGERGQIAPRALPDGKHALFTIWTGASFEESLIAIADLATGEHRVLLKGGADARYVRTGHILYSRGRTLMAVPFDLNTLQLKGEPAPVIEGVRSDGTDGKMSFDVSDNGTAVYLSGGVEFSPTSTAVVDLATKKERVLTEQANFGDALYAPDGTKMCVIVYGPVFQVAVYDLRQGILTPLTFSSDNWKCAWMHDGSRITYSSNQSGVYQIYSISALGGGTPELLFQQAGNPSPSSWMRDGSLLAYVVTGDSTGSDIWLYTPGRTPKTRPFLATAASESSPRIAPDGHWLVYASDESGRNEIYLRPFPSGKGKWRLSSGGGTDPKWSPDGKRVYFGENESVYMIPLSFGAGSVEAGRAERILTAPGLQNYDVSPDGRSLVVNRRIIPKSRKELNVVLNWFDELNKKASIK